MSDDARTAKMQQEDKIRCARFLLEMIEKYGSAVNEDIKEEKTAGDE